MKNKKQGLKTPLAQFIAIIALSMSIFLVVDLGRRAAANYRVQREAERLNQEVGEAQQTQNELRARLKYVQSDTYIEAVARRDLKWARPGETLVVVLPTPEAAALTSSAPAPQTILVGPTATTPVQAWWILFFGPYAEPRYTRDVPP